LNTDLFAAEGEVIPAGMVVVGAALEPGAAPITGLRAGDRVEVLGTQPTTGSASVAGGSDRPKADQLAAGSVWSVEEAGSGSSSGLWVSVLVPVDAQGVVAQAAADGLLRLSLVGAGR
jgi:hypothetical protein